MRNEINSSMNYLFALFISFGLVSCGIWKKEKISTATSDSNISSEKSQGSNHFTNFVSKIEFIKLCDPHTIFVLFTLDTAGVVSDPDFKISKKYPEDDCKPDSLYIEQLKVDFVRTIPMWELLDLKKDTNTKIRLSIPITLCH
jgi:hypothetical protein